MLGRRIARARRRPHPERSEDSLNQTSEAFPNEQRGVLTGMATGLVVSIVVILAAAQLPLVSPASDSVGDRLYCYLPWLALMAAPLAIGISEIAAYRYFHAEAIDGGNETADPRFRDARACLQNTLEQTVVAVMAQFALVIRLPMAWLDVIPALVFWFVIARIIFRLTYARGAAARSFGFAATFYPSVLGLIAVLVLTFWRP